jgi:hypothetical protein
MQLHEKYKDNFDVPSEGASSGVTLTDEGPQVTPDEGPSLETREILLIFSR